MLIMFNQSQKTSPYSLLNEKPKAKKSKSFTLPNTCTYLNIVDQFQKLFSNKNLI